MAKAIMTVKTAIDMRAIYNVCGNKGEKAERKAIRKHQ